jgi:REP element-mobilizing transposase RayT
MHCHIIFSTKNRDPLLVPNFAPRLFEYIGGTLREQENPLVAAGGMPDHVHLLVSLNKQTAVADAVRDIKSNSSRWIHDTFPKMRGFAWQAGYGAFAVSYSNISRVKKYIAEQAEHHRVRSFQEEFLAYLKRHGMEYDERYVWD